MFGLKSRTLLLISILAFPHLSLAEEITDYGVNPALGGYSPVSYFSKNIAEKGNPKFSAEYNSEIYYLASIEQLALFNANQEQYLPQFGGVCPYSLALGRQVAIDPTRFKIINGKLYLFHNSEELDALKEWNKQPDEDALLDRANGQFILFEFN